MLRAIINGETHECEEGISILQALRTNGIDLPALCYDDRLEPSGICRLCSVIVQGRARPVPSCMTPLVDGMVIETHTPDLEDSRRTLLELLAQRYPTDHLHRFPEKDFHRYIHAYGLEDKVLGEPDPALVDDSHPYIHVDMSKCIYCYRCVRICEELQGQFVWQIWNRGAETRIVPDSGTTLRESSCVSCGACVDTCPTGALEDKSILSLGTATNCTKTTCAYCGTGCEMNVGIRENRIVSIRPVLEAPVSRGHLCVKGRYAYDFVYASDRISEPMVRENGAWKVVGWDEAIAFTAASLKRVRERYGLNSIGVLGSARATNEENYLAQKFARIVLGTNNIDCCARVCHAPTAEAMKITLGTGAATNSFNDIEKTQTILVCGANPTENHPIVGARIKEQVLRGANLIVIDPRQIELTRYAQVHLALRPGTNVPLLNALANTILEEELCDTAFLEERVLGIEEFRRFVGSWTPEKAAPVCGVEAKLIRQAARLYAGEKPAMAFHGLGVTEHGQGTEGVLTLVNLALLTGNIGKVGTGINPLRGQNNVQGSAHMGCEPNHLTGYVPLQDGRDLFEQAWGTHLPTDKGLNLMEMMDAGLSGTFKALWAIGYDVLLTNPNATATRRALASLDSFIVQDMFLNESAKEFASVFLPAASSFEKDGTFMNAERRVQRVRKIIDALGNAKPDWEIICAVARAMGRGEFFGFTSSEAIWDEIRRVWKAGSGMSYQRLERAGLQWPCLDLNHPGTEILHANRFPIGQKANLTCIEYIPTEETTDAEFPFMLMTGRTLYQFNAGTMTMRTPNAVLQPTDFLDISPQDAAQLTLKNGDPAKLRSRYGEALLTLRIAPVVKPGELFATFHTTAVFLNNLTGPYRDRHTSTPEYKVTAVRVEKV